MRRLLFQCAVLLTAIILLSMFWSSVEAVVSAPVELTRGIATTVELHQFQRAVLTQRAQLGRYPETAELERHIESSFQSKLKDIFVDAWGNNYQYKRASDGFILRSIGPDAMPGTDDDITLTWRD